MFKIKRHCLKKYQKLVQAAARRTAAIVAIVERSSSNILLWPNLSKLERVVNYSPCGSSDPVVLDIEQAMEGRKRAESERNAMEVCQRTFPCTWSAHMLFFFSFSID